MPATFGFELSDAGFLAASCEGNDVRPLAVTDRAGATDWPGFASLEGSDYSFGRAAEDSWFVRPRFVAHTFWSKLTHEPSAIVVGGKPLSFSELAYFFLREFAHRAIATGGAPEKIVLAVPGAYLKDAVTEDEKIGFLLGMAADLKLPLAGVVDLACASLCDPHAPGFTPALPVVVVDVQLEAAEFSLLAAHERLERKHYLQLPDSGYVRLMKHLTATMGNRFLRHTAFDIMEDGRIEQAFFRQTKEFLARGAEEHRYQINTVRRNYEMVAKHDQLAGDARAFVDPLAQALAGFVDHTGHAPGHCTIALTSRSATLPGLEARLRSLGFLRQLRLPAGAAAAGAARIGAHRLVAAVDLADVPVERSVPLSDTRRTAPATWETRLHKSRRKASDRPPTHAIIDGFGYSLAGRDAFTIGGPAARPDLELPDAFSADSNCLVALQRESGRLWFSEAPAERAGPPPILVEAGDRLSIRTGSAVAEILFAHCSGA